MGLADSNERPVLFARAMAFLQSDATTPRSPRRPPGCLPRIKAGNATAAESALRTANGYQHLDWSPNTKVTLDSLIAGRGETAVAERTYRESSRPTIPTTRRQRDTTSARCIG